MHRLFALLVHLGAAGPLLLGIADSSFLVLPLSNDLLLVVMIAANHHRFPFYVGAATIGSALGVLLLDLVSRKEGEEGLKKMMSQKRFDYFKKKMGERAGFAVAVACIAPPPFPFSPVIAAASAFQYPRKHLLGIVLGMRAIRFSLVGVAAILLGHEILRIAKSKPFFWAMIGFIALCAIGSAFSVMNWIRRSRSGSKDPAKT
ncbi:MAG: VTT domain-containing protein [Bryobacteraceae bacterium]